MNFYDFQYFSKKRRGISSIVGALLFTILMVATFTVFGQFLDAQIDIVDTQKEVSDIGLKKLNEEFSVSAHTDASNELTLWVHNSGQNPVEISTVWIMNKTMPDQPTKRISIDAKDSFIPNGVDSTKNILASQDLYLNPDSYDFKVISSLGTLEYVNDLIVEGGVSGEFLRNELVAIPPDVLSGQNMTLAMFVTNVSQLPLASVSPFYNPPLTNYPSNIDEITLTTPSLYDIDPYETVLFKWQAQISGTNGTSMNFTNYATGMEPVSTLDIQSNISSEFVTIHENPDQFDDLDDIILNRELFTKPEFFFVIPAPFGDSSDKGLWGINVANPTGVDMYVNKVVISLFSPNDQFTDDVDKIFAEGACNPTTVAPTPSNWSCPVENQLVWQNLSTPIKIDPKSAYSFLALVEPGDLSTGTFDLDSIMVDGFVSSDIGSFGKTGYHSSMQWNNATDFPLANVFLTTDKDDAVNPAKMRSIITGITSDTVQTFNVVLADLDTDSANYIEPSGTNTKLVIDVPPNWEDVTILSAPGFSTSSVSHGDGSVQIIGDLTTIIHGDGTRKSRVLEFSAKAPIVTDEKMYVLRVYAPGIVEAPQFAMGPTAEIILQVVP